LRAAVGDTVVIFVGKGTDAKAQIVSLSRHSVELRILETHASAECDGLRVVLATAVPKGERFRWLVEKAVELGVRRIVPLDTARSVVRPGDGKLEKMRQTVIAASKQSGRGELTQIDAPTTWELLLSREFAGRSVLIAHPTGQPLRSVVRQLPLDREILLVAGPEGGFTREEIDSALDAGAHVVNLGPLTLRIETAAIALASFVLLGGE
jgi:16S rRNA (uracil1498-N3)-methyltransferase